MSIRLRASRILLRTIPEIFVILVTNFILELGLFGPETLEHALKCQPLKTDVTTRQMQVVALQQLLGKRKELTVPVTGILNAATLNAVQVRIPLPPESRAGILSDIWCVYLVIEIS